MRWFNTRDIRSSIYALLTLRVNARTALGDGSARTEQIRQTMLELMELDGDLRAERLARRIRYADLEALWFMRGELMGLLARTHGELAAREKVDGLSSMFDELLPAGLRARQSPLSQYQHSRPQPEDN